MEFVIQLLKSKKKEIEDEYENETSLPKILASKFMTEQINNAVKTLEYEYYWKHLKEVQPSDNVDTVFKLPNDNLLLLPKGSKS